jgi:hypothetical protein
VSRAHPFTEHSSRLYALLDIEAVQANRDGYSCYSDRSGLSKQNEELWKKAYEWVQSEYSGLFGRLHYSTNKYLGMKEGTGR